MPSAPYDTLTTVINTARVRLNDRIETLAPIGGKLLDNTQPFSQQVCNGGWRKLQEFLADLGYTGLKQETTFTGIPSVASPDPMIQARLDYNGYFDGVNNFVQFALPQGMIRPYDFWERPSGTVQAMTEMDLVLNGLPAVPKLNWNRQWEWRDDAAYFPGALVNTDLRLRYAAYLSDFVDSLAGVPWYAQTVPIMRCLDAFADYMCREVAVARGEMDAAVAFQTSAENNARLILNRDTARPKSIAKASEFGKMRDKYTPRSGADMEPVDR